MSRMLSARVDNPQPRFVIIYAAFCYMAFKVVDNFYIGF